MSDKKKKPLLGEIPDLTPVVDDEAEVYDDYAESSDERAGILDDEDLINEGVIEDD